jgi:DNA polymerase III delta prime subunit
VNIDAAVRELYQVPLGEFVAERKRLAKELAKPEAKTLLARRRPTISAWAVNQLWWHARDAFDRMMETAEKLRKGHADADKSHREAIAKLRARAATILKDAGHAASEGVLRRVTTTLSAIAAAGGWEPSEPGTLADDLDPPGFGAIGITQLPIPPAPKSHPKAHHGNAEKVDHAAERKAREAREAEEAEARRQEHERKQLEKKRDKLDDQIAKAREHAEHIEDQLAKAREHVADLERARRELD